MALRVIEAFDAQCTLCRKARPAVSAMFGYGTLTICGDCVTVCQNVTSAIVEQTGGKSASGSPPKRVARKPSEIKRALDAHVIGQDYAKEKLAVALYEHSLRIAHPARSLQKANVLLIGPTGTGKTLLAQTMAKIIEVPFVIGDASAFTPAGYLGQDAESVLANLFAAAGEDVELAQKGIVYIDEFDKLARQPVPSDGRSLGLAVQQQLLKLIEGTTAEFLPAGKVPRHQRVESTLDTSSILFVLGGAFTRLESIVERRLRQGGRVGFADPEEAQGSGRTREGRKAPSRRRGSTSTYDLLKQVTPADLEEYGVLPELIGRLPVITPLAPLTEGDLFRVLIEPTNNVIDKYRNYFELSNSHIIFTRDALREVAHMAAQRGCGARGLVSVMEEVLHPLKFAGPDQANTIFTITGADVRARLAQGRESTTTPGASASHFGKAES